MLNIQLAGKYARALFELAVEEKNLDVYGEQLNYINETITGHEALAAFIGNHQIKAEVKQAVLEKLFKEDTAQTVYHFLLLLTDKCRGALLREIAKEYKKLANAAQNIVEAKVTVAHALSTAQEAMLIAKLESTLDKHVVLEMKIDQSILGGVVVRIGDKLIDGSVLRQMQGLHAQLLAN